MARKMTVGPAADPELLILSSLAGGPRHGYAMMQEIAVFSGIELGPGTLYTAITRLVDEGWIEPVEASGRQRPYQLTPAGLDYLRGQLEKMRQLASFGLRKLRTV
jgi:DNA-binding PadR family transcriptional regulator